MLRTAAIIYADGNGLFNVLSKRYAFFVDDDRAEKGKHVVIPSPIGRYVIGMIVSIDDVINPAATKFVVCVVDDTAYKAGIESGLYAQVVAESQRIQLDPELQDPKKVPLEMPF